MARYLITGGAGFIGSAIAHYLDSLGEVVSVLDNLSTGSLRNLADISTSVKFIEGDVRDLSTVQRAAKTCDYVLHHAAISLVGPTIDNPLLAHDVNLTGTLTVLEACRSVGVQRVVCASSAAVYGNGEGKCRKESSVVAPTTPYAVCKAAGEEYAMIYSSLYGLEVISLRYFNVFGPNQGSESPYAGALPVFVQTLLSGGVPVIHGDGRQTRDFIYVKDVARANVLAATSTKIVGGEALNIGTGQAISITQLLSVVQACIGREVAPHYEDRRTGDVQYSEADISLAQQLLGFNPVTSLKDGISEYINWYCSCHGAQVTH